MKKLFIALILLGGALVVGFPHIIGQLGGAYTKTPEAINELSAEAKVLVSKSFEGIPAGQLRDYHTHMIGINTHGSGASVNPKMLSWAHPTHKIKALVYMSGAGVPDLEQADKQYLDRLVSLIRNIKGHGKHQILAFDHYYEKDGSKNLDKSEFYTPNEYVMRLAKEYPDVFNATISVHPYRKDAIAELEKWAAQGAKFVKWLPNAQGMDPADPAIDDYYKAMKRLGLTLLSHIGEEQAVEAEEDQKLGNPLKFRRPLDLGLKVVMAHCGSLGVNEDLDNPGQTATSFDLFLRLMDNPKYKGQLFGELSAMTQYNRLPTPLSVIIKRSDLHDRIVNGSDYPLPALNVVIRTSHLVKHGFITEDERKLLNEIYDYNPLLFDFVLKRTLKHPTSGKQLPTKVFLANPAL